MDQLTHDSSAMSAASNILFTEHEQHVSSLEEDKLWSIVRENSADFNAWTSLIQQTEKLNNLTKIRKVYDSFLAVFPLCYGYWKRYADHEACLGSVDKIVEVYERAVQAVTYSLEIWMHFCTFAMMTYEDPNDIRRLFEQGISYVGTDYLSHLLWDKYIEFEHSQQEWSRLAHIYTRILQIPTQQLERYYNSFKQLATSRPLIELQSAVESPVVVAATAAAAMEVGGEGGGATSNGQDSPKPDRAGHSETGELEMYLAVRKETYKKAKVIAEKIQGFETAIRRPYFHVKALDERQLCNWHRYLDFVEKEGDFVQIVKLYERCLIACASYPEYWIRYAQYMEAGGGIEIANDALARATQIFLKKCPEIHIFSARFKEQTGDMSGARAEYHLLNTKLAPGLLESVIRNANMEQRQGNIEMASSIYETAIETEKGKEGSQSLPFLLIQYSRFLHLVTTNIDRAREVLVRAVQHLPLSKPLLEALIHFESIHGGSKHIDYLDSIVEQATAPKPDSTQGLSMADREEISSIFLEFVDLFGDIHAIKKAEMRHKQLFSPHRSFSESKKRPYIDHNGSDKVKASMPSMATSLVSRAGTDPPDVSASRGAIVAKPDMLSSLPEAGPCGSMSDRAEAPKPNMVAPPAQGDPPAATLDMVKQAKPNKVASSASPVHSARSCVGASDRTKVAKQSMAALPAQAGPPYVSVSDTAKVNKPNPVALPVFLAQTGPPYPSASNRVKAVAANMVAASSAQAGPSYVSVSDTAKVNKPNPVGLPVFPAQTGPPYPSASDRVKAVAANMVAASAAQAGPSYVSVSDTAKVNKPNPVGLPVFPAQTGPSYPSASDRVKAVATNMVAASAVSAQAGSPYAGAAVRVEVAKLSMVTHPAFPASDGLPCADGQVQWGAGYGPQGHAQQSQNWQQLQPQQVLQVQTQQWNPGYAQQGGYGAYGGGYDNHEAHQPQLPLSQQQELLLPQQQLPHPPKHQGYEGYGQGYTQQALPQQIYGQPAPPYALPPQQALSQQNYGHPAPVYTPPQQQSSGQPGHYAGYQ